MGVLGLVVRIALVFGLLALVLWFVRRTEAGRRLGRGDQPVQVIGSTRLGKGASVALVKIGGCSYALGVTEQSVTLLTRTDADEVPSSPPVPRTGVVPWARRTAAGRPALVSGRSAMEPDLSAAAWSDGPVPSPALLVRRPADERPSFAAALQQQLALLVHRRPDVPVQRRSDEDLAGRR